MRLGMLAVDLHLAALTRALGFRSRLEETRDVEPDIETNASAAVVTDQIRISILPLALRPFTKAWVCSLPVHVLEILLELRLNLVERHRAGRLLFGDLDDVEAELGLDQIARRAGRELERHVVERADHLTLLEESEIAAIGGAARILRSAAWPAPRSPCRL